MSLSDPIGDLLTRLRNGQMVRKSVVKAPYSKMREGVLAVLQQEGLIRGYTVSELRPNVKELSVELTYHEGRPAIINIQRVSKPGCRVYRPIEDVKPSYNGLGISILSTSRGILSDADAKAANVGGEVLCTVF
jgi:small subunit ribosomal protein S8